MKYMKYRRLKEDELHELEKEFVRFLASNGIPVHEWNTIKEENPERVGRLIEEFSDLVFERVLGGVEMLERREKGTLQIFSFSESRVQMVGLQIKGESDLDFRKELSPEEMTARLVTSGASLQLMRGEKEYRKPRNQEIFEMLEAGCLILKDDRLYTTLLSMTEGQQSLQK